MLFEFLSLCPLEFPSFSLFLGFGLLLLLFSFWVGLGFGLGLGLDLFILWSEGVFGWVVSLVCSTFSFDWVGFCWTGLGASVFEGASDFIGSAAGLLKGASSLKRLGFSAGNLFLFGLDGVAPVEEPAGTLFFSLGFSEASFFGGLIACWSNIW